MATKNGSATNDSMADVMALIYAIDQTHELMCFQSICSHTPKHNNSWTQNKEGK